jgi:DNA-binding SARP family transcriptional activator/tetratricopeptide (TPR) repeat protein
MSKVGTFAAGRSPTVRFVVLGLVAIIEGDTEIPLSSPVHRVLLSMLLLHANRTVSANLLAEAIWGDAPPATGRASLQNHVMRLRRILGAVGARLVTHDPGYLMEVRDGELDLSRFTRLRDSGRLAAQQGDWHEATRSLQAALGQWTGEPLANVRASDLLAAETRRLIELRLTTVELRIEAELRCGRHSEVIGELYSLVTAHPFRERFRELLMMALYRDGRQAEALAAYQEIRSTLVDELGIDPGNRIRRLHQQILAADPALTGGQRAGAVNGDATDAGPPLGSHPADTRAVPLHDDVVPRQLPPAVNSFVGREAELRQLARLLDQSMSRTTSPTVVAIRGTAGVGKTALAVHWAHQVSNLFPGGQLHIDLRGFAPSGQLVTLAEAVRCLLDALGIPADRVPASVQAQVGLYRSLLADRGRVLVLLDNARDAEQARPLLPGASGCMAIVTSRDELTGLAAVDGARMLTLDVMSEADARRLLADRLGDDAIRRESRAVDELCAQCARLPLALAVAAARATLPPGPAVARLVDELKDARSRLDALDTGDPASSIRAVLSWSYRCLSGPTARMFRLLGLQHGPDIGVYAAASLAGIPVQQARTLLTELTRVQMLTQCSSARFACHDLLRAYAAERAEAEEDQVSRHAALRRLFDHYLHTGAAADRLLYPARDRLLLGPAASGVTPEPLAGHERAVAWFEAEYKRLLAAIFQAGMTGFGVHAWKLAWALSDFMERRGYWDDWARSQQAALDAASALGDVTGMATTHRGLGNALIQLGARDDAYAHLQAAQVAYQQAGERVGEARVILDLAMLVEQDGNEQEALQHAEHALNLLVKAGHRAGQGRALNAVGWYCAKAGQYQRAIGLCERAVALCAELGDQVGAAAAWDSLGLCHRQLANYPAAIACGLHSVELTGQIGDRYHQADALVHIGDTYQAAGDLAAARDAWQRGMLILDELRHPHAHDVQRKLASASH